MRAFVAVELSQEIRDALAGMMDRLKACDAPVKWVEPKNIHLTLKFLGEIADDAADDASAVMRKCAEGLAPFELALRGAGAFPTMRKPRVFFVEAHDTPATLAELARRLNREMTRLGVEKEDRPFRAHVTLGRMRNPAPAPALTKRLTEWAPRDFGAMTVDRMTLIQSQLTPRGPIYTPVAHTMLGT